MSSGTRPRIALAVGIVSVAVLCVSLALTAEGPAARPPSSRAPAPTGPPDDRGQMPLIGDPAPAFVAETTLGTITFPDDYKGNWVILFSHPGDFTPVCTTEFMTFAKMHAQFKALNCHLLGLSVDSKFSHIAWLLNIEEKIKFRDMEKMIVRFPVIADTRMEVSRKYGMIHPAASSASTVRALFLIDPEGKIRAILYYPATTGRNFQEIMRLLIALQTSDRHDVSTPADWQPGEEVILPPPGSCGAAAERLRGSGKDYRAEDWFLSFKKLPAGKLSLPPGWKAAR